MHSLGYSVLSVRDNSTHEKWWWLIQEIRSIIRQRAAVSESIVTNSSIIPIAVIIWKVDTHLSKISIIPIANCVCVCAMNWWPIGWKVSQNRIGTSLRLIRVPHKNPVGAERLPHMSVMKACPAEIAETRQISAEIWPLLQVAIWTNWVLQVRVHLYFFDESWSFNFNESSRNCFHVRFVIVKS